ncbi:MAG: RNA polymerase sigma factor [Candidatus Latescibacteria bacterium]|jgi:RNA polymerase sigma-70 factor, ECF subfamily|nr:RNA polymerase sigma factor [Candidatus Latescibacterota bacterium]
MEEYELIDRLIEGDNNAIEKILERYKGPLFAFILRMISNHADAEDIFQETWIRVIRYIRNFRRESKFSTWLFQIALNLCRDAERKKKRWFFVPIDDYKDSLSCEPDIDPVRTLKAQQVQKIVSELPVKMREVVVLRYFHDLKDHEISEIVNCPVGTVKSRFYRASKIIRTKWERLNRGK